MNTPLLTLVLTLLSTLCMGQTTFTDQRISEMIEESIMDCKEYHSTEMDATYTEWLRRMYIIPITKLSESEAATLPNVTDIQHRNKCNQEYRIYVAEIEKFNPLMYQFNFVSNELKRYRIGSTPYYIEIHPKL